MTKYYRCTSCRRDHKLTDIQLAALKRTSTSIHCPHCGSRMISEITQDAYYQKKQTRLKTKTLF